MQMCKLQNVEGFKKLSISSRIQIAERNEKSSSTCIINALLNKALHVFSVVFSSFELVWNLQARTPTIPMARVNVWVAPCGSRVHKQSRTLYVFAAKACLIPGMAWARQASHQRESATHYAGLSHGPAQMGGSKVGAVKPRLQPWQQW